MGDFCMFFFFGNRFKELRLEKNLTQSELVKDFNQKFYRNYTATAISRYENNKRLPEYDALKDFAEYFDVSVAYLIGESDIRKNDITEKKTTPEEQPLSELFSDLSEDELSKVIEYVDFLKSKRNSWPASLPHRWGLL